MSKPEGKPVVGSKTIWANLLTLAGVAITAVADHTLITGNPVAVGGVTVANAVINMLLRLVTKEPIR